MLGNTEKYKMAALAGILLLAAFFRFYLITEIPPGLYPDEAANGNNALEALRTGPQAGGPAGGFKIFYPENNGREGLFINLQAVAINFLGAEPWTLRIVSAVFGTLTVLGIFLLAKELFPAGSVLRNTNQYEPTNSYIRRNSYFVKLIPLLSALFLATSYWHINFSRIGFRAILVPFFAVFGAYWLLKAIRTEKISSTLAAGIATGLGFHTYIAFRFMPFVLAVPALLALRSWRAGRKPQRCVPCVVALFLFITLIVALPIGLYFLQHPQDFFGRGGQVSIFSAESPTREFFKSTALTLGMFNARGDCNGRHNLACEPQLFWPVGILFLIGLALTVRDLFKKPLSPIPYTLSAWFILMMFPATLTREGLPHALRAIGMIPPVMIFAAMGGAALWHALIGCFERAPAQPAYQRHRRGLHRIKKELAIAAVLFLIWIPVNTYRGYFIRFAHAPATRDAFASDLWAQGRYLAALPDGVQKFVIVNLSGEDTRGVPAPAGSIMFATDTFDAERRRAKGITYVTRLEDIQVDAAMKTVIMPMNPRDDALVSALRERFPALGEQTLGNVVIFQN